MTNCKGITKKGVGCCKIVKETEYCFMHRDQAVTHQRYSATINPYEEEASATINPYEEEAHHENPIHQIRHIEKPQVAKTLIEEDIIKKYKEELTRLYKSAGEKNKWIKNMKEQYSILQAEKDNIHKELEETKCILNDIEINSKKYDAIMDFERMKSQIKQIFSWKSQFYIENIRDEKKYHSILENIFNMDIKTIVDTYYEKKRKRNLYCHPYP